MKLMRSAVNSLVFWGYEKSGDCIEHVVNDKENQQNIIIVTASRVKKVTTIENLISMATEKIEQDE